MMGGMDEQAPDIGDGDEERRGPTGPNASRQVATSDDSAEEYVSLREAREMFLSRGRPVTNRTLQRSCNKQYFTCEKIATADGEKWFALKSSVVNRIAELDEFDRLREQHDVATGRETQREASPDSERPPTTTDVSSVVGSAEAGQTLEPDQARPDATGRDVSVATDDTGLGERERQLYDRLVETYQQQIEELAKDKGHLQSDKTALLRQLDAKDRQIDHFFRSERDTKTLAGSLQSLVSAIWPGASKGERYAPVRETLDSGLDRRDASEENSEDADR